MQIDIKNIENTVKSNNLQEVKTSVLFQNSNIPHPEGLASYEIFGEPGTDARQLKWGYIDLGAYFIHPLVYKILIGLKRELYKNLIKGEGTFALVDGEIIQVLPNKKIPPKVPTGTGISFLKSVWNKINFKPIPGGAHTTNVRRKTLSLLSIDEVFINKWLVIPAFYRDVDVQTNKRNEYNVLYSRLMQLATSVKMMNNMGDLGIVTEAEKGIQSTLFECFTMFITFISGSHGFVHEYVMGKTSVYSARLVISAGSYNYVDQDLSETDADHSGVPLITVAKIFFPFMLYGINNFFNSITKGVDAIYVSEPGKEWLVPRKVMLHPSWKEIFSPASLEKRMDLYQDSRYHRLQPIQVRTIDDKKVNILFLKHDGSLVHSFNYTPKLSKEEGLDEKKNKLIPLTWMHLFYMVAYKMVSDKHVYITRYPIEDMNSIYPSKINIIPCSKYERKKIAGVEYPRWPIFPEENIDDLTSTELDSLFEDTLKIHTTYKGALGADHDGDMVNINPVFTEEANADAAKQLDSVLNLIGVSGNIIRDDKDVVLHAIYALTYKYDLESYEKKVINY